MTKRNIETDRVREGDWKISMNNIWHRGPYRDT